MSVENTSISSSVSDVQCREDLEAHGVIVPASLRNAAPNDVDDDMIGPVTQRFIDFNHSLKETSLVIHQSLPNEGAGGSTDINVYSQILNSSSFLTNHQNVLQMFKDQNV